MPALSGMQAEALLRTARAGRPLYDDLRPAYTRLDALVALLRRRGFTGLMYAAGRPGEGVVWFDHGRLHSGWLLVPGAREIVLQREDPLAPLRLLWDDGDAVVAVHAATPPPVGEADAAVSAKVTGAPAAAASSGTVSPPQPAPRVPAPPRVLPGGGRAAGGPAVRPRPAPRSAAAAVPVPSDESLAGVPWERFLPEALARVRRHRGGPLALQLEEAVNVALAPDAAVSGLDVLGPIAPERGAAALQSIAEGLKRVAGAAFTERLLGTLGRDFACEDALKPLFQPFVSETG